MQNTAKQQTKENARGATGVFDLEERTLVFAQEVRAFIRNLPRTAANTEDIRQLVKSSGSIGANYIEANDSLGKKDFGLRIKIARKEAKESVFWLLLLDCGSKEDITRERQRLAQEAQELVKILSSIAARVSGR